MSIKEIMDNIQKAAARMSDMTKTLVLLERRSDDEEIKAEIRRGLVAIDVLSTDIQELTSKLDTIVDRIPICDLTNSQDDGNMRQPGHFNGTLLITGIDIVTARVFRKDGEGYTEEPAVIFGVGGASFIAVKGIFAKVDTPVVNTFKDPVWVFGASGFIESEECVYMFCRNTAKLLLKVGTAYNELNIPEFVFEYNPDALIKEGDI